MIAILIAYQSVIRLAHPVPIAYGEAILIAMVGLAVNLTCAWLLRDDHDHDHHHARDHHHHHGDNNLRAAYVHVLADAATSVLAIGGLILALTFQWAWIDPVVGLIGACVIASWSYRLIVDAGHVLIDMVPDQHIDGTIRQCLEINGDRVSDLHLWQVGPGHRAAIVSIVTDRPQAPSAYKDRLGGLPGLSHVTMEVQPCLPEERNKAA
jgi:cation diffusion facilitator family transporter